jgi:ubiquinone/menaquinone biosynthesis C-methylase UbiE
MSKEHLARQRRTILSETEGEVLEIGFGTGLNMPHYPERVQRLTVLEPNAGMDRRAKRRIDTSLFPVERVNYLDDGLKVPIEANRFDCVVSTWTLCSIRDVEAALCEVHRILKPGGKFYFIEHGLSPDPKIALWQDRLNWLTKTIGAGCNINRDIMAIVGAQSFSIERCENFYMPDTPRLGGYTSRGLARK